MKKFTPFTEFISAIRAQRDAYRWIRDHNHQVWYAYAAAFAIILVSLNYWGMQVLHDWMKVHLNQAALRWLDAATPEESGFSKWKTEATEVILFAFDAVYWIFMFWLKIKVTKYMIIATVGPLISWVSEQTENEITGMQYSFSLRVWVRDLLRSVAFALMFFIIETGFSIFLFIVIVLFWLLIPFVAPVISMLGVIALVLVSSLVYGLTVFDPIWERRGMGLGSRLRQVWSLKWKLLGAGLPFHLLMTVPVVSIVLTPIVLPIISSVGAVLSLGKKDLTGNVDQSTV